LNRRRPIVVGDVVNIPLTKGKIAIVDLVDADLGGFNWYAQRGKRTWYACRLRRKPQRGLIWLHREIAVRHGLKIEGLDVDHRDGDGLNCRRLNLRAATDLETARNAKRRIDNTSGFKGVTFDRASGKWMAQIQLGEGHHRTIGRFPTAAEAGAAYAAAAKQIHGEFARLS
jgi:AP2 domain/HNH endonuclease